MRKTNQLFQIIQALSKSEKRYFKLTASAQGAGRNKTYLRLFNVLSKKEYEDGELCRILNRTGKQLADDKNYLHALLLNTLARCNRSAHSNVRHLLNEAEALFEKSLFEPCYRALAEAKRLAKKNDMHWAMLEIFRVWEINLALRKNDTDWIKNILEEKEKELQLMLNTEAYRDLDSRMYLLYASHNKARKKNDLAAMRKIMNNKLMQNESAALTFESKFRFYNTHALYWEVKGNAPEYYKYVKKSIDLYYKNPEKISINLRVYIIHISNLISGAIYAGKYKEAAVYLARLKETAPLVKSPAQKVRFFYHYYGLLLEYSYTTAQFDAITDILPSVIEELSGYENQLSESEKTVFYVCIANVFFGLQQYRKCIFWLNRIRNELSLTIFPEMNSALRIFYLIVHYEAGNTDILPNLIQSVERFLKKKEQLYKFETAFIYFFRNELPKTTSHQELLQAFQKLKTKILPLTKDPYERNAFAYFDYISWLESKIQHRPFADVLKEKANK